MGKYLIIFLLYVCENNKKKYENFIIFFLGIAYKHTVNYLWHSSNKHQLPLSLWVLYYIFLLYYWTLAKHNLILSNFFSFCFCLVNFFKDFSLVLLIANVFVRIVVNFYILKLEQTRSGRALTMFGASSPELGQ